MPNDSDHVTVERLIPAPPEPIFDLIAHPERHQDIDGSGTVRAAKGQSKGDRLALGSKFGMGMKMGMAYSMESTVIDFEEGRRLAWQSRGAGLLGKLLTGGRIWRYELEPVDGGTLVKETWDISEESALSKPGVKRMAKVTEKNMAATLERIEEIVTS